MPRPAVPDIVMTCNMASVMEVIMDTGQFDSLVTTLSARLSRRRSLVILTAVGLGGVLIGPELAVGTRQKKNKRGSKGKPPQTSRTYLSRASCCVMLTDSAGASERMTKSYRSSSRMFCGSSRGPRTSTSNSCADRALAR